MLGTGNFPDFLGKYPVSGKLHSGTQTSSVCVFVFPFLWSNKGVTSLLDLEPNILEMDNYMNDRQIMNKYPKNFFSGHHSLSERCTL